MTLVVLNLTVFMALFVALALVRVRRFRRLAYPIMVISWLIGELAPWWLGLGAVGAVVGGAAGWFEGPAGRLAAAIGAATAVGLVVVQLQAWWATRVLARALTDAGLGPARLRPPWRRLLRPFVRSTDGLTIERDLSYGPHPRHLLDLYRPAPAPDAPLPLVVQIHGGSWTSGRKDTQQQPLVRHLARHGYLVATITYRRGGDHRLPEHAEDVATAIDWLRRHGPELGADPSFLAVTGASAGAHLAAVAATAPGRFAPPGARAEVSALIPIYGTFDLLDRAGARGPWSLRRWFESSIVARPAAADPALWDALSPVTAVSTATPPTFVIHGRLDTMLFVEESRAFVDALRHAGAPVVAHAELPGAQHAFDLFWSTRTAAVAEAVRAFLDAVRTGR